MEIRLKPTGNCVGDKRDKMTFAHSSTGILIQVLSSIEFPFQFEKSDISHSEEIFNICSRLITASVRHTLINKTSKCSLWYFVTYEIKYEIFNIL